MQTRSWMFISTTAGNTPGALLTQDIIRCGSPRRTSAIQMALLARTFCSTRPWRDPTQERGAMGDRRPITAVAQTRLCPPALQHLELAPARATSASSQKAALAFGIRFTKAPRVEFAGASNTLT